ncbi:MAG: hypothetical protein ABSH20_08595 [Tepidisphaeraceae bacterium]|jgi:hypothetical protein
MILRHGLLSIVVIGLFAGMVFAKPGVVRTRDGRTLEGEVTDKGLDGVTIVTRLGTISIARDEVAAIDYGVDIKEAYQKRLAALPRNAGAKEHFEIARWLYDAKAFALARQEVNTVLSLDPNSADAVQLRQMIDREAAWEAAGKTGLDTKAQPGAASRPAAAATVRDRKYLDADQINQIRMAELKETDRAVRVRFEAGVEKRYTEYDNVDSRDFAALSNFEKALRIMKKGTADMRKDVKIINDPQSMMEFKTRILPMVLNGCAATNCHGGVNAGSFQLFNPANDDAAVYTNFYILTRTAATVAETRRKMIDRTYPQNSLLVQFALPRERADFRHPEAQGFTPVFKGMDDPRCRIMVDWMNKSLLPLDPDYHIDYVLPGSTAPTSQPAALPVPPQPTPPKQPEPAKQPPAKAQPAKAPPANPGGGNDAQNKLDEIRGRLRPVGIN